MDEYWCYSLGVVLWHSCHLFTLNLFFVTWTENVLRLLVVCHANYRHISFRSLVVKNFEEIFFEVETLCEYLFWYR